MDYSRRSIQRDDSKKDVKQVSNLSTMSRSTIASEDDFEHIEHLQPKLQELLELLTTKIPELAKEAQTEVDGAFPTVSDRSENRKLKKEEYLKSQNEKLENQIKETESKCKDEVNKLQETIGKQRKEIDTLKKAQLDRQKLDDKRSTHGQDDNTVMRKLQSYDRMELKLKETEDKLQVTKAELDDTKTRLSRSMGVQLNDNNPNIADLSDKDRPTKLAERFLQLYDNQWTDAFEVVNKIYKNDEMTIGVLYRIFMDTMAFCEKEAVQQTNEIQRAVTQRYSIGSDIPSTVNKQIKEFRRNVAVFSGQHVYKKTQTEQISNETKARLIPEFVKECFQICWLMTVQDPPLAFGRDVYRGESFNSDKFKAYTQSGNKVAYVVWPVLLLHEKGPVLCKGIAQGISDKSQSLTQKRMDRENRTKGKKEMGESEQTDSKNIYLSTEIKLTDPVYRTDNQSYKQITTITTKMYTPFMVGEKPPSDYDVETFIKWREEYGTTTTRDMMGGERYDNIRRFCKQEGII